MLARFCYNRAMIEIFDTHTHLNVDNFAGKEQEEIDFAAELGVVKMNIVGFDKPTINKSLALSERYDQLYSTIGWHPTEAGSYSQEIEDMIVSQLDNPKVVALGEIGLDYYWMEDPKETQMSLSVKYFCQRNTIYLLLSIHVMHLRILTLLLKKLVLVLVGGLCTHTQDP